MQNNKKQINIDVYKMSNQGLEYLEHIEKLAQLYYRLTNEEIETIKNIAKKY